MLCWQRLTELFIVPRRRGATASWSRKQRSNHQILGLRSASPPRRELRPRLDGLTPCLLSQNSATRNCKKAISRKFEADTLSTYEDCIHAWRAFRHLCPNYDDSGTAKRRSGVVPTLSKGWH